jgi:arsenate reductase-like glutaredoxin family protein
VFSGIRPQDVPAFVMAQIRNAGVAPTIIEYLKTPPDRATLVDLLKRMGMRPRELLREKGAPYGELGRERRARLASIHSR